MSVTHFEQVDLDDDLPDPGLYCCTVAKAQVSKSSNGNRMVRVVYELAGVPTGREHVTEYFVLEGDRARGVAWARRRLVQLYWACGLGPRAGDLISPAALVGAELQVQVEHECWQGRDRLRVVNHRPGEEPGGDDHVPF
jgi:hypothetical protein